MLQATRADRLLQNQRILLLKTVLLETEWGLRYRYGFERQAIVSSLRALAGLPDVEVEDAPAVAQALDWYAAGLDFADALHLASCGATSRFATFDRALVSSARRLKATDVQLNGLSSRRGAMLCSGPAEQMRRASSIPTGFTPRKWNGAFVRAIAPRRYFRVLPTRTRPSLFGSD